jgi:hypothetical protein
MVLEMGFKVYPGMSNDTKLALIMQGRTLYLYRVRAEEHFPYAEYAQRNTFLTLSMRGRTLSLTLSMHRRTLSLC